MKYAFTTRGVCSTQVEFELENNIITNVKFTRGCNGNTQGVAALSEGMRADELIKRLEGINCNGRGTSCPDQLARAVRMALEQQ